MNVVATLLRAAGVALLCLPSLVQAQAKVGERFGDWVFECVALAEGKTAHLPAGASGAIDQGKPFQYTLETCLPQRGCIATYLVGGDFLKSLQGGKQLSIQFAAGSGRQPISVAASLNGLAEGLKAAKLN